ncbi:MAG: lipid A export permease/ATP-binding protein MsbA [Candidatus Competibacteraceae bacterium]|nr:lipid A export permease/ATP-binding protein MsbA [Candidatus Competibacteraceae bacterium]MBK8899520.1 lipid A export permease/ATP-binding protein MsbA [Candidatus Competibacteraceae bacterium]MBK9952517.1 lipid A export permease/ATP-binding protein MsbA [Candidatus Competibacteraceae bacterium]
MKGNKTLYLRLLRYVKPYSRIFALALAGTAVAAITEPLVAALIKPLLDGSFVEKDPYLIRMMPLLLVGVFIVRGIAAFIGSLGMEWIAHRVVMDLRNALFARLLALPTRYFDDHSAGNLLSRLTYDVNQVLTATTQALVALVRDGLAVTGLLGWMLYLNWKLSLLAFLIAPGVATIMRVISQRLRRLSRELQDLMGELTHAIDEVLQGHRVIKIFGAQAYERQRFNRINNRVRQRNLKLAAASEGSGPLVQLLAIVALGAMIYFASLQSAANQITVGGFVSLFGAMAMLLAPIKRLTKVNEQLQRGLAAAETIFALLDEPPEPDRGTRSIGRARGAVAFRDLSHRYRPEGPDVLEGLNLEVQPGETVALVGPSGSGKTTLMSLLPRFYEPHGGDILLDDVPIRELQLVELRANIAFVSQDIVLFNDTVAANIAYGAGFQTSEADLIRAAENAHAMEFIRQLPQGLQTLIGENGARLSGGQRQRIAIARALLKNAPILILDEATSALDTHSERKVQQALDTLRQGRTAFVIAHRLSTIETADRIVVLDRGRLVETGTHTELLALKGLYASLYRLQTHDGQTTKLQ